ncbi:MAG: 2-haloacid dehalogenase [Halopseudomonas sp.]|jgi:2-haloacid dehalogenase|uniref:haloacid dehalogenase type II n=1 Tax=Halopseudomonas sp. TaxID=2901191 RepID=UPI0039E29C0A
MTDQQRTPIIVFDVNETLLDITTLSPLFERVFGDGVVLREWFAQLILYSQTMTLSGRYAPFGELAIGTLHMVGTIHGIAIEQTDIEELKQRLSVMPAHTDVAPALNTLRKAGFRLVTLSNSPGGSSPSPLERAGLGDFFERSFSVDAIGKFKPAPETYQMVADELSMQTIDLVLVACHLWDTAGAQAVGCHGALLTRPHNAILPVAELPQPNFISADLGDLIQQLIKHWKKN